MLLTPLEFLSEYITMKPGDICTYDQQVIGHHNGLYTFTIGQSIHQGGLKQKYSLPSLLYH